MKKQRSETSKRKSGIKKAFVVGALILILLTAAVLTFVLTRLDFIVKAAIEKYGTQSAGVSVRVESVNIQLREGSAAIRGLTIDNPAGFTDPKAFSLGETGVGINIRSLAENVKVIDDIHVLAPKIFVEINSNRSVNLNVIRKNLERSAAGAAAPPPGKTERKTGKGAEPRLIIRRILFSDGSIDARIAALNNKTFQLRLPSVEMRNLGGKNGATPDELTRQIIGELCRRAVAEVERKVGGIASEKLRDAVKSEISPENLGRLLR
jgi:hypothetical protein